MDCFRLADDPTKALYRRPLLEKRLESDAADEHLDAEGMHLERVARPC